MNTHEVSQLAFERMVTAVERVRDRLRRAARALELADIPYAVVGENAVAAWVGEVDEAAVRNAPDVDLLIRRADLERAIPAMATAGFVHHHAGGSHMFLDGPNAKARDAVHIIFAGEKVRPEFDLPAPDVDESKLAATFRVVNLEPLVSMKLTAFRTHDLVQVRDLIDAGLVDRSWVARLPAPLGARLQQLLDTPDG